MYKYILLILVPPLKPANVTSSLVSNATGYVNAPFPFSSLTVNASFLLLQPISGFFVVHALSLEL